MSLISIKLQLLLFIFSKPSLGEIVLISDKASVTRSLEDLIFIFFLNYF